MLTVLLSVPVLALAAVPNFFQAGTVISAQQVNSNFANLDTRVEDLETATPRFNVIGMAKVTGSTVHYFSGSIATGVTSTVQADGSLDIRISGNIGSINPNRLLVFASADNNLGEFAVANARMFLFSATQIGIQAATFRSNTAVINSNATLNVMVVALP
jgi:hypothetical protein